jgi:Fur family ferric uptake transcriptional regulator
MDAKVLDKFHDYLKGSRLRLTQERDDILETIYQRHRHFTATDVHKELQKKNRNIGLATVYRTLPLLVKASLIREADRPRCKEEQTYEATIGQTHHDHLICEVCGTTVEFEEPGIEQLQIEVARRYGFKLRRHYLDLRGVCTDCQNKLMEKAVQDI